MLERGRFLTPVAVEEEVPSSASPRKAGKGCLPLRVHMVCPRQNDAGFRKYHIQI